MYQSRSILYIWKFWKKLNTLSFFLITPFEGISWSAMAKELSCELVVCQFEFRLRYYFHFRTNTAAKGMDSLIRLTMD